MPLGSNRAEVEEAMSTLMRGGERVLACAYRALDISTYDSSFEYITDDVDSNIPAEDLTFVGLVSLIDPPRLTVPDAVISCQQAGIKVIMVTGIYPHLHHPHLHHPHPYPLIFCHIR